MTCPFHDDSSSGTESEPTGDAEDGAPSGITPPDERGVDRREFMKSALVIGGTGALSTVTGLYGVPDVAAAEAERVSVADRENRQHAWDDYEFYHETHEQTLPPAHHLLLHVDYTGEGEPGDGDRREAAEAFRQVERALPWSHEGVMFTVGYSASYFDRFDERLPRGLDPQFGPKPGLLRASTLVNTDGVTLDRERPVAADEYDACIHLASDHVQHLLAVEAALWGERDELRDVTFEATLEGVFTKPESYPERRVGFAGHDAVTERLDSDTEFDTTAIPGAGEDDDGPSADLSMGFNDQYRNSLPRETNVTLLEDQQLVEPKPPGVFAQGSVQHVSKIDIDLAEWYDDHDTEGRRKRMFSSEHTAENTGRVGEELGNSSAPGDHALRNLDSEADDVAELTEERAESGEAVGHAQKCARARFDLEERITDEGQHRLSGGDENELLPAEERQDDLPGHDGVQRSEQVILRRDVDTTDQGRPGNHFVALMRFNPYMVYMRQAMNGVEFDSATFGLDGRNRIEHDEVGDDEDSGVVNYFETQRRGNYLVPPLTLRALPHPRGRDVELTVARRGDRWLVESDELDLAEIDPETIQFGWFYDVNRARGAEPSVVRMDDGGFHAEFPADATRIADRPGDRHGDVRVRLFAKETDSRRPVRGTDLVDPA